MSTPIDVAVYYFGNYHADARNARDHGPGWTEWDLVRRAEPRWPGHFQPRVPAWGYEDEADPAAMARKIAAAADHGIASFIFDWYWYDDGPFLERSLDDGFLKAANNHRLQFALMWANHDWHDIHPTRTTMGRSPLQYPGKVTSQTWDTIIDRCVNLYFAHPQYWRVGGRPYFSIYDLRRFVDSAGSVAEARRWLDRLRRAAERGSGAGVHLNVCCFDGRRAAQAAGLAPADLYAALGFDSVGSYCWVHHVVPAFPQSDYRAVRLAMREQTPVAASEAAPLPFIPNVTQGWDSSPRTVQSDPYMDRGYPWIGVFADNTPEEFRLALEDGRRYLEAHPDLPRVLTINAWNEWTEGSYLEPDTRHGMAYLEAIRSVFGAR